MNFDTSTPVDTLLGRLLAFIIMFQQKIEYIKCKLAGNQQFHTRLAFQILNTSKNNQISAEEICQALRTANLVESENNCAFFLRRYSKNNGITYEEFLKLVSPKANKSLSQRMMIRTYRKGADLQDYILLHLLEMFALYIKMSVVTENIRKSIQYNEELSHLQIIEFFHLRITSSHDLISFINISEQDKQDQEYDIDAADAVYLSYHIKSGNQIGQFTDLDIKELICPIDMNFQKPQNTRTTTFYAKQQRDYERPNPTKTSANFLGKTYQKIYQQQVGSIRSSNVKKQGYNNILNVEDSVANRGKIFGNKDKTSNRIDHYSIQDQSYGGMYIDNFTKSSANDRLQINRYAEYYKGRPQFEVFQDQLDNHSSLSKQSAFDRS